MAKSELEAWKRKHRQWEQQKAESEAELKLLRRERTKLKKRCKELGTTPKGIETKIAQVRKRKERLADRIEALVAKIEDKVGDDA